MADIYEKVIGESYLNNLHNFVDYNRLKELKKMLEELKVEFINVDKNDIKQLAQDIEKNYYKLFCIFILKDELFTEELDIIKNMIDQNKYKYHLFYELLISELELDDEIIENILQETTFIRLEKPFDYKYHILKRQNVSNEMCEKVLKTYSNIELDEDVEQIYYDLECEFNKKKISSIEEIKKYPYLEKEYKVYKMLKNYQKQKNMIKN